MPTRRLSTSNYGEAARLALADAVAKARAAAGFTSRGQLAAAAGSASLRSIDKLELGEPGVGQKILYAVARVLPGWDEDTPRLILEGGVAPDSPALPQPEVDITETPSGDDVEQPERPPIASRPWLARYVDRLPAADYADLMTVLKRMFRAEGRVAELEQRLLELEASITERVRT